MPTSPIDFSSLSARELPLRTAGTLTESTAYTASRGPTIFSTEDQWIIDRGNGMQEVVIVSEDGKTMSLAENVYDGFGRAYARSR